MSKKERVGYFNAERYSGDYLNGLRHGKGMYDWANNDKYIGDWINDRRTGFGEFYWNSGESKGI